MDMVRSARRASSVADGYVFPAGQSPSPEFKGIDKSTRLAELQWMRGLAVLFVVFFHAAIYQQKIHNNSSY